MTKVIRLDGPVEQARGIGPARARLLGDAGISTVLDLLYHLPHRYEDRRAVQRIADVAAEGTWTLRGRLRQVRRIRTRRRGLTLVRGVLEGDGAALPVVWFNRPYLADQVVETAEYLLSGRVRRQKSGGLELVNASCEPAARALHGGRVVPVYPSLGRLGPAALRRILQGLLEAVDLRRQLADDLPAELRRRYHLPSLAEALQKLHRPGADAEVELLNERRSAAHRRLIYGEFLELQLELGLLRALEVRQPKEHRYRVDDEVRTVARQFLPFRLTPAQKRSLREIVEDLRSPYPMLRLLQGDVGSGKTVVAALALVVAMESGLQGAFMAPTELLAEQHYGNLRRLLGRRYRLALVTGSSPQADAARRDLARGRVQLAVGTHALIQEAVHFRRLGLAVIDEQHRFGVVQRQMLQRKGKRSDLLVMTATPIPRSLALTAYGDLETSVLDELPPGRQPVRTEVVGQSRREQVYRALRQALQTGAQAYVVVPLIDEGSQVEAVSVAQVEEKVRSEMQEWPSAVLHGRLAAADREEIMRSFAAGRLRLLVTTTVIEVGVDVPAATMMVIEGAERFGLAQLHQLRGRVGRGDRVSYCFAIHGGLTDEARKRLQVFASTGDGFQIAEADLEIRGPGELLGTRQAGLPRFQVADLLADRAWLERARRDARKLLQSFDRSDLQGLRCRVEERVQQRVASWAGG